MSCPSCCYRRLPTWYMLIALGELLFGIIRMGAFFSMSSSPDTNEKPDQILTAGFTLDWIGSLASTLMGMIITLLLLLFLLRTMFYYCFDDKNRVRPVNDPSMTMDCAKFLLCSRPMNRFVALNCNCPCYIPRPRLRFTVRLVFSLSSIVLRTVTIILYATSKTSYSTKITLIFTSAISTIFPVLAIILDFYQYRVWWHYRPSCDNEPRSTLSSKHVRYIPYHLIGKNRSDMHMGNEPCRSMSQNVQCSNRNLEHLIIFHSDDYKPQKRWGLLSGDEAKVYVGFHRTTAEAAVAITHSKFLPSMKPPQMLGFGVYFARSIARAGVKARFDGALICAEVRMGRVKQVTRRQIHTVSNSKAWWRNFDTVYFNHENEAQDEFCVKDPEQILRWVIVVDENNDSKVKEYGLDTEFEDTQFGCI